MDTRIKAIFTTLLLFVAVVTTVSGQNSETIRDEHVVATLIGESTHIQPGQPYRLGLLLKHDPHWHTYWKSTATGYATSVDWQLPEGFSVSDLSWPTPRVYDFQGLTEYVYEGEILLVATLMPPPDLPEGEVDIAFTAEWLMCAEVCIPGDMTASILLPVRNEALSPSPKWASLFKETDAQLPTMPTEHDLKAWKSGTGVVLQVKGPLPDSVYYFDAQAVFKAKPTSATRQIDDNTLEVLLELDEAANAVPSRLKGVLKASPSWAEEGGSPSLEIDLPIAESAPAGMGSTAKISLGILTLAFAGGLILNLMPCVFPVLGIKIMGFVGQAGSSRRKIVAHGLVFTAGVLLAFWILAGALLILRASGSQIGWGFQLQSPAFVIILTILLFAFALNLSGLFEVGQSAVGVGSNLTAKSGYSGSFFSGVLATVVATPCAAPFLAPALGAALTLPPVSSLLVFTAIALGLSTPYLLLSAFPGLVEKLPRPGPWMETFKQAMGFLLYATVAYLVWVLAGQLTEAGGYADSSLMKVLLSLVVTAVGLWIYGRWGAFHRKGSTRLIGSLTSLIVLGIALFTGFSALHTSSVEWQKWEPGKAEQLARQGNTVYVDFTARWCVTCRTNKTAVFSSQKVLDRFSKAKVVALKADWTNQDPEISSALAAFGRSAVPFNLVYGPSLEKPVELPEILTPGIVLKALQSADTN